jgi:transposase
MGYLLSQQLVAAGETVLNVPATLASRVRVLITGQPTKSDTNDAHSVAVAALRAPTLASVRAADHVTVCRLLAKHHNDLGRWRNKLCCRLHALVGELVPDGIAKQVVVNQARSLIASIESDDVAAVERHRQAVDLVDEIDRLDDMMHDSRARITAAVEASQTTPRIIAPSARPTSLDRDLRSRSDRRLHAHRLQRRPDPVHHRQPLRRIHRLCPGRVLLRRPHHPPAVTARQPATEPAIHIAAIVQIRNRHSPGRCYYERKLAEGKTPREAIRALKRQLSDVVWRHLIADAQRLTAHQ